MARFSQASSILPLFRTFLVHLNDSVLCPLNRQEKIDNFTDKHSFRRTRFSTWGKGHRYASSFYFRPHYTLGCWYWTFWAELCSSHLPWCSSPATITSVYRLDWDNGGKGVIAMSNACRREWTFFQPSRDRARILIDLHAIPKCLKYPSMAPQGFWESVTAQKRTKQTSNYWGASTNSGF